MDKYQEVEKYWSNVFSEKRSYNINDKMQQKDLDDGIEWVSDGSKTILDYGCGAGRLLFRCLRNKNVEKVIGIDLSIKAIEQAKNFAKDNSVENKTEFINGVMDKLKDLKDESVDACILSNILDNLIPDDSEFVMKEVKRIVKPGGKILVKLNPYISEDDLTKYNFKKIKGNLFKEESGMYLWNQTDEEAEEFLKKFFMLKEYKEIYFSQYETTNRLYYLLNN